MSSPTTELPSPLLDDGADAYEPRPVPGLEPRRIVLAKGSLDTRDRKRLVEKVCAVYPDAKVVEDLATPHNQIDLGEADLLERHRLGKGTLLFGEHRTAVRRSEETGNTCPNYWHFSVYGFCPYGCRYCYLAGTPGIWRSPTVKIFVNLPEILAQIERAAARFDRPTAFFQGKLQDGLALDPLTGYSRRLVPFFARQRHARMTLLTKSTDVENLLDLDHRERSILSWTVNPPGIVRALETNTPPMPERIEAMRRVSEAGYPVRAVVMPILPLDDWLSSYGRFLEDLLSRVHLQRITLGSICSYPMAIRLMERAIGRGNFISRTLQHGRRKGTDGRARFPKPVRVEAYRFLIDTIRRIEPRLEIGLCLEAPGMFERLGIQESVGLCNCVV